MKKREEMDITAALPEEFLAQIISLTSPRDACKVSVVSSAFKSAACSDVVWERLLPSDYQEIVSDSVSSSGLLVSLSKKDLYLHLCHNPILIKKGAMSFTLEKESGKKCYMVGVKGLDINCGGRPTNQMWRSRPESRFSKVFEGIFVGWIGIKVKIEAKILSPKTRYGVYIVFKFADFTDGLVRGPIQLSFYLEGRDQEKHSMFLRNMASPSQDNSYGWLEIEIDEFFNENGDDERVNRCIFDFLGLNDNGVVIEGIELRPKNVYNSRFEMKMPIF